MPPAHGCLRVQSTQGRDKWAVRQQPWRWRAVFRSWMGPLAANSAARLFWLTNQRRHNATGCHPNVRPQDPQTDHGQVLRQKRATAGWSVSHEMSRSQPARGNGNCWRGMRIRFCWNDSKCTDQPNVGGRKSRDPQRRSKRNLARVDPSSAGHHDRPAKKCRPAPIAPCASRGCQSPSSHFPCRQLPRQFRSSGPQPGGIASSGAPMKPSWGFVTRGGLAKFKKRWFATTAILVCPRGQGVVGLG